MTPLEVTDFVLVASRVLDRDVDTLLDLVDLDAVEVTLNEARVRCDLDDPVPAAATLLHGLVRRRPLHSDGGLVATAATLQFLALNGFDLDLDPPEAGRELLDGVASGAVGPATLATRLTVRLRPLAADEKEDEVFERFTRRARSVVMHAQEEARTRGDNWIGTEHILLGLLREGEGVAAEVLGHLEVSLEAVHQQVGEIIGQGQQAPSGHIPFSRRAKKALELSLREALQLGHNYIGTEHILLGLVREGEGVAAQALVRLGVDLDGVRQQVILRVGGRQGEKAGERWSRRRWRAARSRGHESDKPTEPDAAEERRASIVGELNAVFDENDRLRGEISRLRDMLLRYGIDPDAGGESGEARSA